MRILQTFSLSVLFSLAACNSLGTSAVDSRQNAGPCPTVGALYDTGRIVAFDGETERYNNIAYTGEIVGVRLFCRYVEEEPLVAEIEIGFAFGKGPQATDNKHTYNYFVAVMRRNRTVLAKEYFSIEADFRNSKVAAGSDVISRIVIPRRDSSISGGNFEVLVGFELTEKQLTYNKDGKRFRLDAGN